MKLSALSIAAAAALISGSANAHPHLQKASPAEGSTLTISPAVFELTFSEAARLTALWIEKDHEPKRPIKDLPTALDTTVRVALPTLTPGAYTVGWRALGADGHMLPGELHFTISATQPSVAPGH